MAKNQLQVGDVGVPIVLTIERQSTGEVEDQMGSATNLKVYFKKPSGTVVSKDASFYTDGSDGKIKYVTEANFTSAGEEGFWWMQAGFTLGSFVGRTRWVQFAVEKNLS